MFRKLKGKKAQAATLQNGSASSDAQTDHTAYAPTQASNGESESLPPASQAAATETPTTNGADTPQVPDYMLNRDAVLGDKVNWRHGKVPDYSAANNNFLKERSVVWPSKSLEDMVSNLVKNWEKEASYKLEAEDWRTINPSIYTFSCNGGRKHSAHEMSQIGTYNALIGEAAFYSAKHTGFDESHEVFRKAMPGGFAWEVTEVYSGPPIVAFKWRHWGRMTGKLVCPIGPDTKLEADPNNQHVEIFGVCIAQLDASYRITNLEIFYDPHELMSSLVDARNLSFGGAPDTKKKPDTPARDSLDMKAVGRVMDTFLDDVPLRESLDEHTEFTEFSEADGDRYSDSASSGLPSDAALINALVTNGIANGRSHPLPASRCPFPR